MASLISLDESFNVRRKTENSDLRSLMRAKYDQEIKTTIDHIIVMKGTQMERTKLNDATTRLQN